jgi:hypothetical protein
MAAYDVNSPYYKTPVNEDFYLDILRIRPVPSTDDDILYTIMPQYAYRPDLLAYDLYGDKNLWWVFSQRNIDILKDPVNDFKPGLKIHLPQGVELAKLVGL